MTRTSPVTNTEAPSTISSGSFDYVPDRPEIIKQMAQRTRVRSNGGTNELVRDEMATAMLPSDDEVISLKLPEFKPVEPRPRLIALQEWEGYVTDVHKGGFTAHLVDTTRAEGTAPEVAEFLISDVADDDLDLLRLGAIFRWSIGHIRDQGTTKIRASQIVFRQLPKWREQDLAEARETAKEISAAIPWK